MPGGSREKGFSALPASPDTVGLYLAKCATTHKPDASDSATKEGRPMTHRAPHQVLPDMELSPHFPTHNCVKPPNPQSGVLHTPGVTSDNPALPTLA